jgi:hypothetical protein
MIPPNGKLMTHSPFLWGKRPQGKKTTPMSLTLDPLDPSDLGIGGQKGIVGQM